MHWQFLAPPLIAIADVIYGWPHTNNHPVWCRRLNPHTHLINIILIAIRLVRDSQYLLAHVINHFLRKNQKYKYFSVTHLSHLHNTNNMDNKGYIKEPSLTSLKIVSLFSFVFYIFLHINP